MAKTKTKASRVTQDVAAGQRREFIVGPGYRVIADANGIVRFLGNHDELLVVVEQDGVVRVVSGSVTEVFQSKGTVGPVSEGEAGTDPIVTAAGEELEDAIFREHDVYRKLVERMEEVEPVADWRARLNEL